MSDVASADTFPDRFLAWIIPAWDKRIVHRRLPNGVRAIQRAVENGDGELEPTGPIVFAHDLNPVRHAPFDLPHVAERIDGLLVIR